MTDLIQTHERELTAFVNREVHYCVSALVHTLAKHDGHSLDLPSGNELAILTEQAFELAAPIPDYESAAIEAGWQNFIDEYGANCYRDETDGQTWACADWQALCEDQGIEPHDREVYEHWIVSNSLADDLEERGEKVDRDFAGMVVWARTCTGQSIALDSVIQEIWTALQRD